MTFKFENKQTDESLFSESNKDDKQQLQPEESIKDIQSNPRFDFKEEPSDLNLKNTIIEIYKTQCNGIALPDIVSKIKKELDSRIPKGWIVFAGSDMVGACSYIENTLVEFKINGISFVIFQTYCP